MNLGSYENKTSSTLPNKTHLVMELAVHCRAVLVDQFERVRPIPVHVTVPVWDPMIAEQE